MASSKLITYPWRTAARGTYRLREFLSAYLVALSVTCLAGLASVAVGLLAYFVAGILLSRFISARVVWWNQQASVSNVFHAKARFISRWIYELPLLVVQIFVARDL